MHPTDIDTLTLTTNRGETPLSQGEATALVDAVMADEALALSATAREESEGVWVFEAICASEPDLDAFRQLARKVLGGEVGFAAAAFDAGEDWVSRSLQGLPAVLAGGFYVHGSHVGAPAPHGSVPILIEAAEAFGTGHHETTSGCLEAIAQVLKRRRIAVPLDVGTGTGVLAIALAKKTHQAVLATDIDPVAVRTARENARINGVGREVLALVASGLNHPRVAMNRPYDLITANILAGPLVRLAPAITAAAAPRGTIILSGILNRQAARVISAYARQGAILKRKLVRGDWTTLLLEKPGPRRG